MVQLISPVGLKHCNNTRSCRFATPSRSIFIIFQVKYKGTRSKILIRACQNPSRAPFSYDMSYMVYCIDCLLVDNLKNIRKINTQNSQNCLLFVYLYGFTLLLFIKKDQVHLWKSQPGSIQPVWTAIISLM